MHIVDNMKAESNLTYTTNSPVITTTPNTLNGTLTLTVSSSTVQEITGTNTGYSIKLPNATTLTNGWKFEFYNSGLTSIILRYNDSTSFFYIPPGAVALVLLESNTTTNGFWLRYGASLGTASGLLNYTLSSSTPFTYATGTADLLITGMSLTPTQGTYFCTYQGGIVIVGNNTSVTTSIHTTVQEAASVRVIASSVSTFNTTHMTSAIIQFNGSEILEIKIGKSSNSNNVTVNSRNLVLLRLGD